MHPTLTCFHCGLPLALDDAPVPIGGGWGSVHCCGAPECLRVLDAVQREVEMEREEEMAVAMVQALEGTQRARQ